MNIKENETVTLSLQTYEDMKNKLVELEKQVKEKTIIKYYMHPIYGRVLLIMAFAGLILFVFGDI